MKMKRSEWVSEWVGGGEQKKEEKNYENKTNEEKWKKQIKRGGKKKSFSFSLRNNFC